MSFARFAKDPAVAAVSLFLLLQAGIFYYASSEKEITFVAPLDTIPERFGAWHAIGQVPPDARTLRALVPDDYLFRVYQRDDGQQIQLLVAYFRSQRTGHAPHSPRNCLPGNGWFTNQGGRITLPALPGQAPVEVNRFIVSNGNVDAVVLYWYQTSRRSIADEYWARLALVWDGIRYHRTDTALVRVFIPLRPGDQGRAERLAADFGAQVQASMSRLLRKDETFVPVLDSAAPGHSSD